MKVCFVGSGSMGQRHMRNLTDVLREKEKPLQIHLLRHSASVKSFGELPVEKECFSIDELDEKYDAIFVVNPTSSHFKTLCELSNKTENFFVEKPVFDRVDYESAEFGGKRIYVACPLRYMQIMCEVKRIISSNKINAARVISSSYLPNWRPGEDYTKCYSARKELGGGVELDLIHEWDYIVELFGFPKEVKSFCGKKSSLKIDTNDSAIYIADYADMCLSLHLDYFGRHTRRELELFTEEETIIADLAKNEIRFLNSDSVVHFSENRDDYQKRELQHFMSIIQGKATNDNDLERATKTLKLALGEI